MTLEPHSTTRPLWRVKYRPFFIKPWLWLVLLILASFYFPIHHHALAQSAGSATAGLLSDRVSRQLLKAQKFTDDGHNKEAQILLENLLKARLNDYEAAVVNQVLGYAYASLQDYSNTARAFEHSLSYGVLSKLAEQSLRLNLGQIYIAQGAYDKGTDILEKWLAQEQSGTIQVYELLAVGFYHLDNFQKAEFYLRKGISTTNKPNKTWFQMLVAVDFAQGHYRVAANDLQNAIQNFPKDTLFWQQLSYAYRQLEQDDNALAILVLSNYLGMLGPDQSVLLAKYFAFQNMPVKAARLMRGNIDAGKLEASEENLLLLAKSWFQAREPRQAASILKSVCAKAADGKPHVFYAQVLTELRDWPEVVKTLNSGLKKGGIENMGQAQLLLGIAYFNLGQRTLAQEALRLALRDKKTKITAGQWLDEIKTTDNNR